MSSLRLAPIFKHPRVIFSDSVCTLDDALYVSVPMLVDNYGQIIWPISSWLRELRIDHSSPLTVKQYAYSLSLFWGFLQRQRHNGRSGRHWSTVDDAVLRSWRSELGTRSGRHDKLLEPATINSHLEVVLAFYRWAQEHRFCEDIIGVTVDGQAPYPIRLVRRRNRGYWTLSSDLLYRIPRKSRRPIPTRLEIANLYIQLGGPNPKNVRDCLMCRWACGSGLRVTELLSLTKDHLPSESECLSVQKDGKVLWIKIVGKNSKERRVPVLPDILLETFDYIDTARVELLRKSGNYSTKELFVGANSGQKLSREEASRIVSSGFRRAGNRDLTLHRLRARFTSLLVQELRREEQNRSGLAGYRELTILERAAEILGHSDLESLRYYLNVDLDKDDVAARMAMTKASAPKRD